MELTLRTEEKGIHATMIMEKSVWSSRINRLSSDSKVGCSWAFPWRSSVLPKKGRPEKTIRSSLERRGPYMVKLTQMHGLAARCFATLVTIEIIVEIRQESISVSRLFIRTSPDNWKLCTTVLENDRIKRNYADRVNDLELHTPARGCGERQ